MTFNERATKILLGALLVCSMGACAGNDDGGDYVYVPPGSAALECSDLLSDYGHGEANYEAAMLDHPTCVDGDGTETMYYDFLDDRGIKYPGWPN